MIAVAFKQKFSPRRDEADEAKPGQNLRALRLFVVLFQRKVDRLATRCRTLGGLDDLHNVDVEIAADHAFDGFVVADAIHEIANRFRLICSSLTGSFIYERGWKVTNTRLANLDKSPTAYSSSRSALSIRVSNGLCPAISSAIHCFRFGTYR